MKKFFTTLTALAVLFGMSYSTSLSAQHRSHHQSRPSYHHHSSSGDGFHHAMRAVDDIASAAMLGTMLHGFDDYTGIRLGYNAASLRTDLKYANVTSDFTSGINVGFVFGWHLGPTPLMIEPGVFYSMKGGNLSGRFTNGDRFTNDISMHSIELPLVLKCQIPLSPDNYIQLQPFFGGFVSFGFAGTTKYNEDPNYYQKCDTFEDRIGFGSCDAGLRMGGGLQVGQFYLECAYDLGLVNLPNHDYDFMEYDNFDDTVRSNTISFNIGFNF